MADLPPEQFRIAELAQRTGLTARTIRYYVAEKLLPPPTGSGPQRLYNAEHLLRLDAIKRLKAQYLPLTEVRRRLAGISTEGLEAIVNAPASAPGESPAALPPVSPPVQLPPIRPTFGLPGPVPGGFVASLGNEARAERSRPGLADLLGSANLPPRSGRPEDSRLTEPDDLGQQIWNRVELAPGVELNYQLTGDKVRDAAVLRLIRNARQILGTVSKGFSGDLR